MLQLALLFILAQIVLTTSAKSYLPNSQGLQSNGGFVKLPLHRRQAKSPLNKRQSSVPIDTQELGWTYHIDIAIGSNNQTVTLNFDTGSPVTWVNPDCSKVPDERSREKEFCLKQPRYDPFTSNTAKIQNQALNLTYGRGSILGSYFTDDIRIGSVVAESATFGVAAASTEHEVGIFGAGKSPEGYPPTVLETLVSQGKINSHAFSVDLKSINETGAVVFGGVDTKKYKSLVRVPSRSFRAYLNGVGMTLPNRTSITFDTETWKGNNIDPVGLRVLFDTGTPTNLLPNNLYFAIGNLYPDAIPYTHPLGFPAYNVSCDAPSGTFDYTFGNHTISVSFQDSLFKDETSGVCTFGFTLGPQDTGQIPYILADSFMRGVYMVFDMDNDEIWMGETADCGSNVVPIGKGKDAVPVVEGCCTVAKPTSTRYQPPPAPTA